MGGGEIIVEKWLLRTAWHNTESRTIKKNIRNFYWKIPSCQFFFTDFQSDWTWKSWGGGDLIKKSFILVHQRLPYCFDRDTLCITPHIAKKTGRWKPVVVYRSVKNTQTKRQLIGKLDQKLNDVCFKNEKTNFLLYSM